MLAAICHVCTYGPIMVYIEMLPNFENYICTLQGGFRKFYSGFVFLYYYVHNVALSFFTVPFDLSKAQSL